MIKFITKFLLIFSISVFANEIKDEQSLPQVVTQIMNVNHQILLIKDQNKDKNQTATSDLSPINAQKHKLLESIAVFITNYTTQDNNQFKKDKAAIDKKVKLYENNTNSERYITAKIDSLSLELDEFFYQTILNLSTAFSKNAKQDTINSILQEGIMSIQTGGYLDIKNFKDTLSDVSKNTFEQELINLDIKKTSYDEILAYLKDHSDLLASNFLFSSLNLNDVISYINKQIPIDTKVFNPGKFTLIVLIFLFFFSIRVKLSKIVFVLLTAFLSKDKKAHRDIQEQFILVIKKPMGIFLSAYAIDVCLSIFYYPSPVPIRFANFFVIAYIILVSWLLIGILDGYGMMALSKIAQKSGKKEVINLIIKILYFIVIVITILLILSRLGFDISTIIASLGIGGLAVALATKDIIANFFASILLLFDNSFSQGDWIVCAGVEGTVVEIGLRKTTIRTFDNSLVFVPNSKIMSENVKNWNRRKVGRQIKMSIGLTYSTTPDQLKECITEIKTMLQNHPGIAKSGEDSALNSSDFRLKYKQNMVSVDDLAGYKSNLFVVLDEFGDNSINILIYCFSKTVVWGEFLETKQDVMLKIMDILSKYETEFAFPSQSIYIEKLPKIEYDIVNSKEAKDA
ncbi:mechanosensitive ion channel family protein [Campylobacter hyointestinalis subsp. hyointestinalis]|uniref:Mechanosensitive ion channel family protein n=1 Tax=Campylobacter hyointestinalis subsp. hyointestinalis TaxID=91352 RepID=A0A9W5AJL9_CAMHY|nr:mechanosensitive ion channel family protein [Campylobacter hyointestinalis]CUU70254.1 mechanosensitive ion channel family protein [Campylobacter hyointestinalis subsp. hyointestinalis]CUU71391.1 mechanosensitive ion channel family protein [Campylobacter hyointestinalis subsp. hyointestinalis]CUU71896.1 mechanosensitive ion channel family protein [Campylobacter hyointestinalis subsp. hyointestinalis]CUU79319.1 mechanosensitive ion channel family protein [Campylobacter hyointestinalis subsp. h